MNSSVRVVARLATLGSLAVVLVADGPAHEGWGVRLRPGPAWALGSDSPLRRLAILSRVIHRVHSEYVDPEGVRPKAMVLAALREVQRRVPLVFVRPAPGESEEDPQTVVVEVGRERQAFDLGDVRSIFLARRHLQGILRFVGEHTGDGPAMRHRDIEYAAIRGLLAELDPHSAFIEPEELRQMRADPEGVPASPGLVVTRRSVPRPARTRLPPVAGELLPKGVAWVRVRGLPEGIAARIRQQLRALGKGRGGKLSGLVLDLRGNGGGLLNEAIRVGDLFLDSGTILKVVGAGARELQVHEASWRRTEERYPMVVLVDGGTAGAAEIVAGALRNQDRAVVVGGRTHGKASLQVVYPFKEDGSALKLTVAHWLLPGDQSIESVGLVPDIALVRVAVTQETRMDGGGDLRPVDAALREPRPGRAGRRDERPAHTLRYLEAAGDGSDGARGAGDSEPDFPVELAGALLREVGRSGLRREMLRNASGLLARIRMREERRIGQELVRSGLDWTAGANDPQNRPTVAIALSPAGGLVSAGDVVRVTATVTNRGTTPLYRLRAQTRSGLGPLDHLGLVFGMVLPGTSRSATTTAAIPLDQPDRYDSLWLGVLSDSETELLAATEVGVLAVARPRPLFRWSWQVDDTTSGNGDGQAQPGETVSLVVHLGNAGLGPARDVQVAVGLMAGSGHDARLGADRLGVGALPVGGEWTGAFPLEVGSGGPKGGTVEVGLRIEDAGPDADVAPGFEVPIVARRRRVRPYKGTARVRGGPATLLAGCDAKAPRIGEAPKGARLSVTGRCGGILRVSDGERFGFVQAGAVDARKGRRPSPGGPRVAWDAFQAPLIALDLTALGRTSTAAGTLRLVGEVADDRLVREYTVLVHTRSGDRTGLRKIAHVRPPRPVPRLVIDAVVPLARGENRLVVTAWDDGGLSSSRVLFVQGR